MALPLVISFTLRFFFQLVDLVFARLLAETGDAEVAAIGLFSPINAIFIALWVGLSGGFTSALSQAFGSQDSARVEELGATMRRLLARLLPLLSLLAIPLWFAIPMLGLESELERAFRLYATTLVAGMPLAGFWAIYPDSVVKAHQATKLTMIAGLISMSTNVVLNYFFALVFGWGVFGLALATVISRLPALAFASYHARRLEQARLEHSAWTPIPTQWEAPLRTILKLAVPGALTFGLGAFEALIVYGLVKSFPDSTTAIASYGVYERLLTFSLMPAAATAVAVVPFVARLLPSRAIDRIRNDLTKGLMLGLGLSAAITLLMGWLLAEPIAGFLLRGEADDPVATQRVVDEAVAVLRLLPLSALALVPFFVFRPVFEAANAPRIGIYASLVRYVALSAPLVLASPWLAEFFDVRELLALILALATSALLASVWTFATARTLLRQRCLRDAIP